MLKPDLFEQLLNTYPAEKRELARQVYHRFAEGDSTQFFTQLFVVLGLYAHYVENVPQAVIEANHNAHAGLLKVREEIGLLAQAIDKRNLNITNHAEKTDELCQEAVAKCNETLVRFETVLKNVGAQVDTHAIVEGIEQMLREGIRRDVITPFIRQSEELAQQVVPTMKEIREAAAEANRLWPARIWKTALGSSAVVALALTLVATLAIYAKFKNYNEERLAKQIVAAGQLIEHNRDAFQQLAIAGVQVKVYRSEDSTGRIPGGFALVIEGADGTDLRPVDGRKCGFIFFTSARKERDIQRMQRETEKLSGKIQANQVGGANREQ